MEKNNKQDTLFYEDTKKLKRVYYVLTVLFYVGFIFGVCTIIIYRFIVPEVLLIHYQPSGEDIIITITCLIFAIVFNVMIIKSERFNYYIEITKNEIKFFSKGKLYIFLISDLLEYKTARKYAFYKEYILIFTNKRKILIITKQEQELKNVLSKLILSKDLFESEEKN
jgi:hypothetical protein